MKRTYIFIKTLCLSLYSLGENGYIGYPENAREFQTDITQHTNNFEKMTDFVLPASKALLLPEKLLTEEEFHKSLKKLSTIDLTKYVIKDVEDKRYTFNTLSEYKQRNDSIYSLWMPVTIIRKLFSFNEFEASFITSILQAPIVFFLNEDSGFIKNRDKKQQDEDKKEMQAFVYVNILWKNLGLYILPFILPIIVFSSNEVVNGLMIGIFFNTNGMLYFSEHDNNKNEKNPFQRYIDKYIKNSKSSHPIYKTIPDKNKSFHAILATSPMYQVSCTYWDLGLFFFFKFGGAHFSNERYFCKKEFAHNNVLFALYLLFSGLRYYGAGVFTFDNVQGIVYFWIDNLPYIIVKNILWYSKFIKKEARLIQTCTALKSLGAVYDSKNKQLFTIPGKQEAIQLVVLSTLV